MYYTKNLLIKYIILKTVLKVANHRYASVFKWCLFSTNDQKNLNLLETSQSQILKHNKE